MIFWAMPWRSRTPFHNWKYLEDNVNQYGCSWPQVIKKWLFESKYWLNWKPKSWIIYQNIFTIQGQPVAVLHGANAPLLQKMIEKEIELERKVLKGDIDREVISFEEAVPVDSKFYRKCLSDYIPLSYCYCTII